MKVCQIMTMSTQTILPDATVEQASRNTRDFNIGLLPVIEKGNVLGVITDRDSMEKSHIRRLVVLNRRNQLTGSVNDH